MERCDFCSAMKMIREYISDERGFDQSEILYRRFENFFRSVEDGWIMGRYAKEKNELYGMEQVALRQKRKCRTSLHSKLFCDWKNCAVPCMMMVRP